MEMKRALTVIFKSGVLEQLAETEFINNSFP